MQTDVLIVGQGISGTLLSWWLRKEGKSVVVVDDGAENSSTRVAAGIMNPVTGRRYLITWLADVLFDFAETTYTELEQYVGPRLLYKKSMIDFFPSPQMRNTFVERIGENDTYLRAFPDQNRFNDDFQYDFGCGEIRPAYTVNLPLLLDSWRKTLQDDGAFRSEKFDVEKVQLTDGGIAYDDITAQKLIFCDGIACAKNPWFTMLPFSANKGEALIIECEGLPTDHLFKKGMLLAPLPQPNTFWAGANYQWEFADDKPSEKFRQSTEEALRHWLKKPFKVLDHRAAVRPATLERRPFVGFHPSFPQIGILNGMGTKGTSLAPYFSHQLVQHLVHRLPLTPQADVHRFNRILTQR